MCSYSLNSLLSSTGSISLGGRHASTLTRHSTWNRVANLPVTQSTYVTLQGRLLAIGGEYADKKLTTAVYQLSSDSWEVISHMTTPRSDCIAAVLPDNQLMVVGGSTTEQKESNSVKFGREF